MSIIPVTVPTGAIRYNTDSNKMECFNGTKWWEISVSESAPLGGRGVYAADQEPGSNAISYVTFATGGTAVDFGDLPWLASLVSSNASRTRGVFTRALEDPGDNNRNEISYVTIATAGNAADFGDLTDGTREEGTAASNAVRGLFCGGSGPGTNNTTDYITIATLGDAKDFGDLNNATELGAAAASSTRVTVGGGTTPSKINVIDYFDIATTGNAMNFGDRTVTGYGAGSCSNGHGGLG